jgi:hypothetical protein
MKRICVVDTSSLLHAAKHSIGKKAKLSYNDQYSFVIYGFLFRLRSVLLKIKPDVVVFALDSQSSIRKDKHYSLYKSKRKTAEKTPEQKELDALAYPQFEIIQNEILPEIGYKNVFKVEGFEADDIIGSICKTYKDFEICIVTSDEDMYQCLRSNIAILKPRDYTFFTLNTLKEKYGLLHGNDWKRIKVYGGCFDKETDILTNRGWVPFPKIQPTDLVYSMDPKTQMASYEKISNVIRYNYDGDMYRIKGRLVDLLITPNHELFGTTTQSYNMEVNCPKFVEIQNMNYKNFTVPLISKDWKGREVKYFTLPEYAPISYKKFPAFKIDAKVWMAFVGIYLSDGWVNKNRNGKMGIVGIAKSKEFPVGKIKEVLDKLGYNYNFDGIKFIIHSGQLALYMQKFGNVYKKHIPQSYKDLSKDLLEILLEYLIICDGCVSTSIKNIFGTECSVTSRSFCTSSKKLADDVQDIASKCGINSKLTVRKSRTWDIRGKSGVSKQPYQIKLNKSKNVNILNGKSITIEPFNDFVYDVTTEPFHTILVRRNGSIIWSGNCSSDSIPGLPIPNSDSTKPIRHIGEKSAINYFQGKLKPHTNTYKAFIIPENAKIINRNKILTILPLKGTPEFKIVTDKDLSKKAFVEICKRFGFASILEDLDDFSNVLKLK